MKYAALFGLLFIASLFGASAFAELDIPSPREQLESGISPDQIVCAESKVLTMRGNGSPACVYPSSAEKLGWEIIQITSDSNFDDNKLELPSNLDSEIILQEQTIDLKVSSTTEFEDDGREIQRSILQRAPAPAPMFDRIIQNMINTKSVGVDGVATFTSPTHEKYSINPGVGHYIENWMPEYIPDGQKLLYAETDYWSVQEGTILVETYGTGINFVPTTFVLSEDITTYDLETSKGFSIGIESSSVPLDEIEDQIENGKEILESQSGNYGRGFVEMTHDGKPVYAYEGGNDLNHYQAGVSFHPDEFTSIAVRSNYYTLDELIPIFESIMK